jgi:DNA polymerase III subunit epsilon
MSTKTFTAIDFETAQGKRNSICQVGIVRVVDGEIVETYSKLVQPPDNFYFYRNIEIHGITPEDTENELTFAELWHEIKPFIENQNLVAHNATFDVSCLKQTLDFYNIEHVYFEQHCTYQIYRENLADLCRKHKIKLNNHDALSDALACAELFRMV